MKITRAVGTVSEVLNLYIQDASVSTGAGLANISATSVAFSWKRNDQATLSSGTGTTGGTLGTYGVSTFTQVNSTSTLGWYEFGVPNGIFTSGRSALLHLYGAPNMVPLPIEVELTKFDNQQYVTSYNISTQAGGVRVSTITPPVGVSSFALAVGVSSFAIDVGVSSMATEVGVSTIVPVGVSSNADKTGYSGRVSVSTLVGVSTLTIPVGVSTGQVGVSTLVGVSSGTWVASISSAVGVSSFTIPVGVSSGRVSVSTLVGVSTLTIPVGVSTGSVNVTAFALPVGVSSFAIEVGVSSFGIPVGVSTAVLLDATYGPAGSISTNIVQVRGIAVASGTGTSSDSWGP